MPCDDRGDMGYGQFDRLPVAEFDDFAETQNVHNLIDVSQSDGCANYRECQFAR